MPGMPSCFVTPNNAKPGEGANFEYRSATGAATQSASSVAGLTAPRWLKLVRSGNLFTASYSADGITWTQDGSSVSINMGATINIGLAVSANNSTALNTAQFGKGEHRADRLERR